MTHLIKLNLFKNWKKHPVNKQDKLSNSPKMLIKPEFRNKLIGKLVIKVKTKLIQIQNIKIIKLNYQIIIIINLNLLIVIKEFKLYK